MTPDSISADVSTAIQGLENLDRKLMKKGIRQSLRASAKPTLGVAKATAPSASGLLSRNVKLRSGGTRKGTFRMNVGIGKKWFTGPAFYGAFVAFGHRVGKRQLGNSRKIVPPNNWLTEAYEQTKAEAVEIFKTEIEDFIEENGGGT